jgi:capsular polysaccharide biosynthesis protein
LTDSRRFATTRTWLWFIVLATIVGATVAIVASQLVAPTYAGRATILVSPMPRENQITNGDLEVTRVAAATLGELATTGPVLESAIRSSGIDTNVTSLAKVVSTRVPTGTSLLEVTVLWATKDGSADLANAIAGELIDYANPNGTSGGSSWQVDALVVDPAVPPPTAEGLGPLTTTLLAALIALVIACSLAFLVENMRANQPFAAEEPAERRRADAAHERGDSRQPIG